jgi:hypothetical protein
VAARTPDGEVAARLRLLCHRPLTRQPGWIAGEVGCGALISAPDTVPYSIWCAARHLDDLVEALWTTVSAGGDMDTTCAIVAVSSPPAPDWPEYPTSGSTLANRSHRCRPDAQPQPGGHAAIASAP